VKYFTAFALSTENLQRSQEELDGIFSLFREYFKTNVETLKKKRVALRVIGDLSLLPSDVEALVKNGEEATKEGARGTLLLAIGYGGRQDIVRAANEAVKRGKEVTEEEFSALLFTGGIPDPDLLIRTGKEVRLSNFLLWQSAYTELYFSGKLFPDFSDKELDGAIRAYGERDRRFGKV